MPLHPEILATAKRGISFEPANVLLIMRGLKTQTRRLLDPQPPAKFCEGDVAGISNGVYWSISKMPGRIAWHPDPHPGILCRYGRVRDRLWVKEQHAFLDVHRRAPPQQGFEWDFKIEYSDGTEHNGSANGKKPKQTRERGDQGWRPARQMPKNASRLMIELVEIRLERLQEMTADDALAEGIAKRSPNTPYPWHVYAVEDYGMLWNSIYAKRATFESNPWVWALTFRKYA